MVGNILASSRLLVRNQKPLADILDLLGPGLSLEADAINMRAFFGREDTVAEAQRFAAQRDCNFIQRGETSGEVFGAFIRAY